MVESLCATTMVVLPDLALSRAAWIHGYLIKWFLFKGCAPMKFTSKFLYFFIKHKDQMKVNKCPEENNF